MHVKDLTHVMHMLNFVPLFLLIDCCFCFFFPFQTKTDKDEL